MTSSPDVLVIGGGIVGAATAYHLARRGASVILLEAERLAFGATGRNLGYIWLHTRRRGPELDLVMPTRDTLREPARGARRGLRAADQRRADLLHDRGPGRRHARVRRAAHGRRRPDAAARRRRGARDRADPARQRDRRDVLPARCPGRLRRAMSARSRPPRSGAGARIRGGHRGPDDRDRRRTRSPASRPTSGRSRPVTSCSPPERWSPSLAAPARRRGADPPDAPPDRPDGADAAAARRRALRTGGGQAVRDLPRAADLSGPSRSRRPSRTGSGSRSSNRPARRPTARTCSGSPWTIPGFDWKPDLAGVSLISEGMAEALPELRAAPVRARLGRGPAADLGQPADHRPRCPASTTSSSRRATSSATARARRPAAWSPTSSAAASRSSILRRSASTGRRSRRSKPGARGSDGRRRGSPDRVHQPVRDGRVRRDHRGDARPVRRARHVGRRHPPRGRARQHRLLLPEAPHGAGDLRRGPPAGGAAATTRSSSAAATTPASESPASWSTSRSSGRSRRR